MTDDWPRMRRDLMAGSTGTNPDRMDNTLRMGLNLPCDILRTSRKLVGDVERTVRLVEGLLGTVGDNPISLMACDRVC